MESWPISWLISVANAVARWPERLTGEAGTKRLDQAEAFLDADDYRLRTELGAAHGLDLAFVWNFPGVLGFAMRGGFATGARRALIERMQRHWVHFVEQGRPEADWPAYTSERRAIRLFDREDRIVEDPTDIRREAWAGADVHTNVAS